ncbi:MAG: AAA family ATPase [Gemmatimonadota bacterium]|nr:AAA family ATPase [Gemmatimonadota bacterium]
MLNAYERQLILFYLRNAASRLHHACREARELADWVAENYDLLALDDEDGALAKLRESIGYEKTLPKREWRRLREILESRYSAALACEGSREDRTARRLQHLGREMDLAPEDIAILEILLRYHTQQVVESLLDSAFGYARRFINVTIPILSRILDLPAGTFCARFTADAPLMKSGLVSVNDDGDIQIVKRLYRLTSLPDDGDLDMCSLLFDEATPSELEWSDFDHVVEERDHIEQILKGALHTGTPGVNILVYGPPGTGKTEFCKTLAARLGTNLYSIGEVDSDGDEPSRKERLQELRLAQYLLAPGRRSILLFDEMEDLLSDPRAGWMPFPLGGFSHLQAGGSKVFLNRLLERTPVPTLWTSNAARETCHTVLRRMTFALELRKPPSQVRARIWERELTRHSIKATKKDAHSLAKEFDVTPGIASGAIAAASLCGGDLTAVRRGVRSLSRVIAGEKPPANQGVSGKFDPTLIQADINPVGFADSIVKNDGKHFSLCLQGPPGTGKSAFVRYLAERLGFQVTQKRASDLMSMWVGGTEQRIAAAFAEARAEGSILVFDEADSLLADRQGAMHSWEVSQVNEMLTWMESHPLPFACTTNFGENLDPATLRRFTFKIALDYLTSDQSQAAFRTYFALEPPPETGDLTTLTPGDFAVVRRKAEILGHLKDAKALAELLSAECEAKPNHWRKMGF